MKRFSVAAEKQVASSPGTSVKSPDTAWREKCNALAPGPVRCRSEVGPGLGAMTCGEVKDRVPDRYPAAWSASLRRKYPVAGEEGTGGGRCACQQLAQRHCWPTRRRSATAAPSECRSAGLLAQLELGLTGGYGW